MEVLRDQGEDRHYATFRTMTEAYFTAFREGDSNAIAAMIDFYGGPGTFASWPARVRAYAVETTPVNILDWRRRTGFHSLRQRSARAAGTRDPRWRKP